LLGPLGETVELVAGECLRHALRVDALHGRRSEDARFGVREHRPEIDELHAEAEVRLVDAEAVHRVVPRDLLDRRRTLAGHRLCGVEHRLADERDDVVLFHEAGFGVELHELVLPIGAEVLVTEAACDLVVALDTRHHQQLLPQLRALRQRVERAGRLARRDEELARAFGCGRHQHRRLDLGEPLPIHRRAYGGVDGGVHLQVALHAIAAQVEVPVLEADDLVDVGAVAQVDEGEVLTVLAAARHPTAQRDRLADVLGAQLAVPMRPHAHETIFLTCSTTSARATTSCWCERRSRTVTVPSATSWSPTSSATLAPARSACFICAFIERPSKERSARTPAARSSCVSTNALCPSTTSTTKTSTDSLGAGKVPSASQASNVRSMPAPKPMPGVGGPPICSDSVS